MQRLISIAALAVLAGCWYPGAATMNMIAQCRSLEDSGMRRRCLDDTVASTNEQNAAKLSELWRITPEKCISIVGMRTVLIEHKYWPWNASAATAADVLRRVMPKDGLTGWSEADIQAALGVQPTSAVGQAGVA